MNDPAILAKLDSFLEVLDQLMNEALAAGVPAIALRRTLLAHATMLFKSPASAPDGIAAFDRYRKVLEREIVPLYRPRAEQHR